MTRIYYDPTEFRLSARGHSGYAESGADIVCAAVSALIQTLPLALKGRGIRHRETRDPSAAMIEVSAEPMLDQRYQALMIYETIMSGLAQIARDYPEHVYISK